MSDENITFVGDPIELTLTALKRDGTPHDLTIYDSVKILWKRPRVATFIAVDATLPGGGTDGRARCLTDVGEIDTDGNWQTQIAGYKNGIVYRHSFRFAVEVLSVVA